MTTMLCTRYVPLDDIEINRTGDGRTVTAYATVFNTPAEIRDPDGHYLEQIAPTAFDKTLAERGNKVSVFYNHGKTLHGTPSERGSMPIGTPIEIRADSKGLLTVTRYNKTALADEVLESIRNGDIRGQSFTGRIFQSDPMRGPHRMSRSGQLTLVTRKELGLREYGPTPFPAYDPAEILNVRAALETLRSQGGIDLDSYSDDEWAEIVAACETENVRRSTTQLGPESQEAEPQEEGGKTEEPGAVEPTTSPGRSLREVRMALRKRGLLG